MMMMFQQASGYSKAGMTRLMLNAFKAIWLEPQQTKSIDQLKTNAEGKGVVWSDVIPQ